MVRLPRGVPGLVLGLVVLIAPSVPAQAQYLGGGFGYPGYGYGGLGYGGLGYGGYGYGGFGYGAGFGGRAFGIWPGVGFSYGFPSYYGWGAGGGGLFASPYAFGYPVQGYGYGYYNPAFPYGLSPIAVQTAIGRVQLNRALRASGASTNPGGVPVSGGGVTLPR
jgi:hypothetical protein